MKYSDIQRDSNGGFKVGPISQVPDISQTQESDIATLFLGPRAENQQLLSQLINQALTHIYDYRQEFCPGDPTVITDAIKASTSYQAASEQIQTAFDELLEFLLKHATPYFSLRYQGHMLWDNTLPAIAGYFATMLHNPNNVTFQASTSTTPLAMLVGWDMCRMVGFAMNHAAEPWSHLTTDGTVANIESLWATRELHSLPFAVRELLQKDAKFQAAQNIAIHCCDDREVQLQEADSWDLLNLSVDEILAIPENVAALCGIDDVFEVWNALINYTQNAQGWANSHSVSNEDNIQQPVIIMPSTRHYSWPKAAAICGYGTNAIADIFVDADARMDMEKLSAQLEHCLNNKIPIAMLVVVCGSTEESAVDNIAEVLKLRDSYRKRGLNFFIHVDAAWGGYMLSLIRKPYRLQTVDELSEDNENLFIDDLHQVPAKDYVLEQLMQIRHCDSVTIDPHKWGYVQYPAGALLYRNGETRRLTTFTGAYINSSCSIKPDGPNVGIFGLEGSRAGASAAAVFLSHRCLRPSVNGYGKIISECLFNTGMFYVRLLALSREALNFTVVPLSRLPAEKDGSNVEAQLEFIQQRVYARSKSEIQNDAEAWQLLRAIGPDQNILDYGFNFHRKDGSLNRDPELYNKLNELIYDRFSVHFETEQPFKTPFILTMTTFSRHEYGDVFMDSFTQRLGLQGKPQAIHCLRSVVMDPYITQTADGSYFVEIIEQIREHVSNIVSEHFQG
ncbi:MAG: pyridoxal-dependent decarboxylase [Gammaproteobacteria bacterium]|nr:pyridoxal-dependent decarboxylase [Gammaproteobacteria bacterium]